MKYKYICRVNPDPYIISILEDKKIKYEIYDSIKTLGFDYYSDIEYCEELMEYMRNREGSIITKLAVFSKQEMEDANWYLFYVTRMGMETKNVKFTFDAKCLYSTSYGLNRYHHLDQVNPFVSSKTPKWKNGYNFCSVETGSRTRIFCSDFAKETILKNEIRGLDFMPVLKRDLATPTPDVSQLVFKNKLPLEAYTFTGKYSKEVCPFCGRIKYIFAEPNTDILKLKTDVLPENIDVFGSEITIGCGFGEPPLVISKKFYNLLFKELKEKPSHFMIIPVA